MKDFALSHEPLDYQLTVHVNNLRQCYGIKDVYNTFKVLSDMEGDFKNTGELVFHVRQLCNYYGKTTVMKFVKTVFKTKVA